tara:strand:- start:280 stop:2187 length:1908 start_codon:yes stop_codon:yes gene_type:complete
MIDIRYKSSGQLEENRFEKIHNVLFEDSQTASIAVAKEIAELIQHKAKEDQLCVLGLATGSSPIKVYEELVRMHQQEGLSFENVVTFNLDEYLPMPEDSVHSYHYFMKEHLFDHVNIPKDQIHIPKGTLSQEEINQYCRQYENKIAAFGGLDFQLLGIGRTGHIGFNEPGSHENSITRVITLDHLTRQDAAPSFLGIEQVPRRAITMGIATVMQAKRIVLLGWGSHKAAILKETIEGPITSEVPASYLQKHLNTTFVLDKEAGSQLTRIHTPWLVGSCEWSKKLKRSAVIWLCQQTGKSILRLTDSDYNNHGMSGLLSETGSAYDLNIEMFNTLQHTITGWPGGKPNADDTKRPERALPEKKRVLIFSPHPDDDVISMGGTLDRLVTQGHDVHVAYQTSGNIAVSSEEATKFLEVAYHLDKDSAAIKTLLDLNKKTSPSEIDEIEIRELKGAIRRSESLAATRYLGLPEDNVHFLDLPFYETGTIRKNPLAEQDIKIMMETIKKVKPHQIYAAGDLADPHGTHKTCLNALFAALDKLKSEPFMKDCWVWLYRGAWHEWELHEIAMAVPMSPDQILRKRHAIFYHQSQKDGVMFQGNDSREFWMRVEDRNNATAQMYHDMGLADYAAMEAFVRYQF